MFIPFMQMALFSRRRQRSLESMSDEELMQSYNMGRIDAFAMIVNRFEKPLFFYILKRVQQEEVARDILQDTFMKLTQHAHRYDPSSPLSAWLYTIARHRSIDYLRKRRYREVSLDAPLGNTDDFSFHQVLTDQSPSAHDQLAGQEFAERLDEALKEINPDQRQIFILREIHGLKFIEIADTLDISENTVKSRMRYALEALRKQLSDFVPPFTGSLQTAKEESP